MSSYRQGYTDLEIRGTTVVGTTVSGNAVETNTLAAGASEIGAAEIALGAVSGGTIASGGVALAHVVPALGPVYGGSPAAGGRSVLAGSGATGAGSAAWVVFPLGTFFSAPNIILGGNMTAITANTFYTPAGSITAGSFYVQSTVASTAFSYLAVGSGRIA